MSRASPQRPLPLPPAGPAPATPGVGRGTPAGGEPSRPESAPAAAAAGPLWLAVHLPRLALEVLGPVDATLEYRGGLTVIHTASARAMRRGIHPGMSRATALALWPGLATAPRAPGDEKRRLLELAAWAGRFTPWVRAEPPGLLLLEIRGSLTLFGGAVALVRAVRDGLREQGHAVRTAVAPAPEAGRLLARLRDDAPVLETRQALLAALRAVPLAEAPLPERQRRRLRQCGIRTVGELLRLPRAGLARRFGPALTEWLDRLRGDRPEALEPWTPPPRYRDALDLPLETEESRALLPTAERLLQALMAWLAQRQAAVSVVTLALRHPRRPPTALHLGTRRPTRDAAHLSDLLEIRLERLRLPAPVTGLALEAEPVPPDSPCSLDLLTSRTRTGQPWDTTLERVEARLGPNALKTPAWPADARPEATAAGPSRYRPRAPRPLWLLPAPRPLLHLRHLRRTRGPERIEAGWWAGDEQARDYYLAKDTDGLTVWIFRDLRRKRWYLHGYDTQLAPPPLPERGVAPTVTR